MLKNEKNLITKFINHLEIERRLSPLTCKHYRRDIEALYQYCRKSKIDLWKDLNCEHIRDYSAKSYRNGLSSRSIQRRLSATRTFFRYLLREKHVNKNPVESVTAPKSDKRLPENIDADRMAKLLDIKGDGPIFFRDHAILELLYSCGLRLGELTNLNLNDIDFLDKTVHAHGKGNKDRILPIGQYAIRAIKKWHSERHKLAKNNEKALFVSSRGKRLSARSVQSRINHWAKQQGIDSKVYPHLFRHSFATHLLESSHDLRGVQELLGHANISTTQVYTHLDFQHLAQIYDQTHPRAKKRKNK